MIGTLAAKSSPVGSIIFASIALIVLSFCVLLLLRHYLPLRTTPAYLLVPIFFALWLPASIVLLVPIDLASTSRNQDVGSRGIWLPERALLVSWRISYWLTFALTWFILPILAEYTDAGYRDPKARFMFSLRQNAQYQAFILASAIAGGIYVFIYAGFNLNSIKSLVMALAYSWGLVLAIYLMGHGLVAMPRLLLRNSSISGRLKRIQGNAAKVHDKMEDAIVNLEDLEAQVTMLSSRKTGSAKVFEEWINELVEDSHLPESQPRTLSRRMSVPAVNVPNVLTEQYLADLSRKLIRARHSRARYLDEWDRILSDAVDTQMVLDSAASNNIEIGQASPHSGFFDRIAIHTPYTRYLYRYYFIPYSMGFLGCFLSLASFCIVWSELIKAINPWLSIISLTVVHHPESERGQIGFAGQVIASAWILYMYTAALYSLTEVKVWRGRALVRRNTHGESAMWYSMQVAKLSVPLSYNFLTFLQPGLERGEHGVGSDTVFYKFLGSLIEFTPLGERFDTLFPIFILVPVCAALFNLYGKVKRLVDFGGVIDDDEENETGYGTGSWREGQNLIEREIGNASLGRLGDGAGTATRRAAVPNNPNNRATPALLVPPAERIRSLGQSVTPARARTAEEDIEEENFLEAFSHRVKNTFDTVQTPKWLQNVGEGIKRPKWMGGNYEGEAAPSSSGSDFTSWFGGRQSDGRVRL
ncbi:LMBR1-like membrane protein-domain-containing protein [Calycina marina]|uniref:LMBR1-like membrane protein-domain-containing protein n=1 Tax=Calycina marina TaxID=1763456 RepID=A0A9P8CK76_9HELO|nr:LMBR1-like membrane protein-domain-containing protein [Calycina marina]